MKISFVQVGPKTSDKQGYGYARKMCEESLSKLGHTVGYLDPTADVEINFIQPNLFKWSGCNYRIAYLPWESTQPREGWVEALNNVDEVWTPSPWCAELFSEWGVSKPIRVYQHGVEPLWSPVQRTAAGRFDILHHGAEALRKGGNDVIQSFMKTLWDEPATLHLKMVLDQFGIIDSDHIKLYRQKLDIKDLVALYHKMDLFFYPSYGEGFGLTPLQAMATGMPVLVTAGWAPYKHLLPSTSLIDWKYIDSPWPEIHPGQVMQPDMDDAMDRLIYHFKYRQFELDRAWDLQEQVRAEYDWVSLTRQAFAHLV